MCEGGAKKCGEERQRDNNGWGSQGTESFAVDVFRLCASVRGPVAVCEPPAVSRQLLEALF